MDLPNLHWSRRMFALLRSTSALPTDTFNALTSRLALARPDQNGELVHPDSPAACAVLSSALRLHKELGPSARGLSVSCSPCPAAAATGRWEIPLAFVAVVMGDALPLPPGGNGPAHPAVGRADRQAQSSRMADYLHILCPCTHWRGTAAGAQTDSAVRIGSPPPSRGFDTPPPLLRWLPWLGGKARAPGGSGCLGTITLQHAIVVGDGEMQEGG